MIFDILRFLSIWMDEKQVEITPPKTGNTLVLPEYIDKHALLPLEVNLSIKRLFRLQQLF